MNLGKYGFKMVVRNLDMEVNSIEFYFHYIPYFPVLVFYEFLFIFSDVIFQFYFTAGNFSLRGTEDMIFLKINLMRLFKFHLNTIKVIHFNIEKN